MGVKSNAFDLLKIFISMVETQFPPKCRILEVIMPWNLALVCLVLFFFLKRALFIRPPFPTHQIKMVLWKKNIDIFLKFIELCFSILFSYYILGWFDSHNYLPYQQVYISFIKEQKSLWSALSQNSLIFPT